MLKITDGKKTICAGPYLNEHGIVAAKTFLYEQINKIDKYPDKSLFFQNPLIIEGWISMVRTLQEVKKWEVPEDDEQWEECAEMYSLSAPSRRASSQAIEKSFLPMPWRLYSSDI